VAIFEPSPPLKQANFEVESEIEKLRLETSFWPISKSCIILGPFPPYEGGIAQYNELLAEAMEKAGWRVEKINYYRYLWGQKLPKSRLGNETENLLSVWNPLTWVRVGLYINTQAPEVLILKYWHTAFVPMYFIISKLGIRNWTKRLIIIDNITPHEWFPFSKSLFKLLAKV
jgi:hypothetical protein